MKRALSLLLAAVLTVSVLGGCGGAAPAETSAPEDYSATGQWLLDTLAKYSTK